MARGSFDAAWVDRPPPFAAELSFSSKYSWEYAHTQESNVGTDSECVISSKGSGFHWLFLDSFPNDGGTVDLVEGVPLFLLKPVTGTMTQDGTLTTTQAGPASYCQPPSSAAPRDGCGVRDVENVVRRSAGRATARSSSSSAGSGRRTSAAAARCARPTTASR